MRPRRLLDRSRVVACETMLSWELENGERVDYVPLIGLERRGSPYKFLYSCDVKAGFPFLQPRRLKQSPLGT